MSTATATARRYRTPVLVSLVVLLSVAAFTLLSGRAVTSASLDPDNPDRTGAQALRRVLEQQGVDVVVVRSAAAFDEQPLDADTTVLVTSAGQLGGTTTERLRIHLDGATLVVAEPGPSVARALANVEGTPSYLGDGLPAGCDDPLFAGLRIEGLQGTAYPSPQGCFPGDGGFLLAQPDRRLTLLGAPVILTNGAITDADNAAVALRLLGGHDRLVWYVPDPADVAAGDALGVGELVPDWVEPALWLLALVVVGTMFWRGRRLGPLVSEPLPVTVTAIESTQSHGRLYRKSRDRPHAAAVLRDATRGRLAEQLALPHDTDPAALAQVLAARLDRPRPELDALLSPLSPPPTTDRDLVELATRLTALEREVRRP